MARKSTDTHTLKSEAEEADWYATPRGREQTRREFERALRDGSPDEKGDWWLTSFGAGFSAHGCRVGL